MNDWLAEAKRDREAYARAVARLSARNRDAWNAILEVNEYFDGEDSIALGTLQNMLRKGTLAERGREARATIASWAARWG